MKKERIKALIKELLKEERRIWSIDEELDQIKFLDLLQKYDEKIISLLLKNNEMKDNFFIKVGEAFVFKYDDFKFFIEEHSLLSNSYTKYKNRIGLTGGKKFLKDTQDIVLNFPFKDCILEGGQTTDEGSEKYFKKYESKLKNENLDKVPELIGRKEKVLVEERNKTITVTGYEKKIGKRKEIFFNEILAKDEIDRLLDEKAFVNWKRYTKDGEVEVGELERENGIINENLIIKGNNLLALYSLKSQFSGKIKLIYIDPPYNTGNDSFAYNDSFNHSTWLTFMKNRLEVAKDLMRDDGVILVQIDNSPSSMNESPELGYLLVLMDEVFSRKNYVTTLTWKKKGNASNTEKNIGTITESIIMYSKDFDKINLDLQEYKRVYKHSEDGKLYNLELPLKTNEGTYERKTMLYPIITKEGTFLPPEGKRWTIGKELSDKIVSENKYKIVDGKFYVKKYEEDYQKGNNKLHNNLLLEYGSLKVAKDELAKLGFKREEFDSPKPEILMKQILEMATNENDFVLDYHLGSGTTAAVAHKMNRKYIGIEQMNYIETISCERLKKVINSEDGGVSKIVDWKGGGNFVYFELAKHNEEAKEMILNCNSKQDLLLLFEELYNNYFLNYNLKVKEFRESLILEDSFNELEIENQKKIFLSMLDLNQLYINKDDIEDVKFKMNQSDKKMTREFYKK